MLSIFRYYKLFTKSRFRCVVHKLPSTFLVLWHTKLQPFLRWLRLRRLILCGTFVARLGPQRIRRLSRSHRRKSWSLVCQRTRKVDGNLWTTQRKRLLVNSLYLNILLHWAPNGPCWSIFVAWRNGRNARDQIHDTPLWKKLVLLFKMALLCRADSYTCSNSLSTEIWNAELEYWVLEWINSIFCSFPICCVPVVLLFSLADTVYSHFSHLI